MNSAEPLRRSVVLVTGGAGFIGSHLTEALVRAGAEVRVLVHYNARSDWGNLEYLEPQLLREVQVIPGDITDAAFVRQATKGCTHIYHLAALIAIPHSYRAPASFVATNIQGTLNLLQAALDFGVERFVHTSTSEVYGTARYVPMDEKHPLQAQSPYAASKIGADKLAESFHRSFGLPVTVVRPFNAFGPRQSARAIVPTIAIQALTSGNIRLGRLDPVRDLTYVEDTVKGFLLAAGSSQSVGEVFNFGTGRGCTIGDLAKIIVHLLGRPCSIDHDTARCRPQASEVFQLIAAADHARTTLGWSPGTTLEDGLRSTLEWIREHLSQYKPGLYNV